MHYTANFFLELMERASRNADEIHRHYALPEFARAYSLSALESFRNELIARQANLNETINKCRASIYLSDLTIEDKLSLLGVAITDISAAKRAASQYRHRLRDFINHNGNFDHYIVQGTSLVDRLTEAIICADQLQEIDPRIIFVYHWDIEEEDVAYITPETAQNYFRRLSMQITTNDEPNERTNMVNISMVRGYHPGMHIDIHTESHWSMGFEIEKTSLNESFMPNDIITDDCDYKNIGGDKTYLDYAHDRGDLVFTGRAVSHVETDSSCGLEIVTHAYDPLKPEKFLEDIELFEDYLESPCDRTCGGHITVGISPQKLKEFQLQMKMPVTVRDLARPFLGVIYGIHRRRLRNSYCGQDPALTRAGQRYSPVHLKQPHLMEMRVFSKVRSMNVLKNRTHIVSEVCKAIDGDLSYEEFAESIRPTIRRIIGDTQRFEEAMDVGKSFAHYLVTGEPDDNVFRYVM